MKKILFIIVLAASSTTLLGQIKAKLTTTDGIEIVGQFVAGTDSTITIQSTENIEYIVSKFGLATVSIHHKDILQLYMNGEEYVLTNGRFVSKKSTELKEVETRTLQQKSIQNETKRRDPNFVLGNAFKQSGAVSLGIGVPCLAAGVALITAGHTMRVSKYGLINDVSTKSQLLEAGYILFPIGASLTIIGIPLHIHGKKIIDMNFNYTGNGIGISMEF